MGVAITAGCEGEEERRLGDDFFSSDPDADLNWSVSVMLIGLVGMYVYPGAVLSKGLVQASGCFLLLSR